MYIISKESNSFGDLIVKVQVGELIERLVYSEGNWPSKDELDQDLMQFEDDEDNCNAEDCSCEE